MRIPDPEELERAASIKLKENKAFVKRLAKVNSRELDTMFHENHEEVFEEINCLDCANCCNSLGPRLTDQDVDRIASSLKIKPSKFQEEYLLRDEDGDLIFRSMPCPFLGNDRYCLIYDDRPKACRDYPHTDRRKMYQILDITVKNTFTCPAVYEILERLKRDFSV